MAGGGGVMVWGIFSLHILGPLVPIEHRLNAQSTGVMLLIGLQRLVDFIDNIDNKKL